MLGHFGRKLPIGHFVCRFLFDDSGKEFLAIDSLKELALGFTGTQDQDCCRSTKRSDYVIVVIFAVVFHFSLEPILRNIVIGRELAFWAHASRRPNRLSDIKCDLLDFIARVRDENHDGLLMVNPNPCFSRHCLYPSFLSESSSHPEPVLSIAEPHLVAEDATRTRQDRPGGGRG